MFTLCLRYSQDRNEAAELLQEGFIKVFGALHQYKHEGSFEGWIKKIMVNTALQHLRRRTPLHSLVSLDSNIEKQSSEEGVESKLRAKELLALVQTLPLAYRMVFNLYVFEGYKHKEIAAMLQISEGTSKSNLHDARQLLKQKVLDMSMLDTRKSQCL